MSTWPSELGLARTRELTLCLLNEQRARQGLAPLRGEARLELAAQRYAGEMVERRFFDHVDPGGLDPQDRILLAGYPATNAWTGENLAYGTGPEGSPVEIVDRWMHSPGHKANILRRSFTEIGIGVEFDVPKQVPEDADAGRDLRHDLRRSAGPVLAGGGEQRRSCSPALLLIAPGETPMTRLKARLNAASDR